MPNLSCNLREQVAPLDKQIPAAVLMKMMHGRDVLAKVGPTYWARNEA